jgi:hypothetical protein
MAAQHRKNILDLAALMYHTFGQYNVQLTCSKSKPSAAL